MINEITDYLEHILRPKLSSFGVDRQYINEIIQVVEAQMLSALRHWNDETFRNTLMLLVSEEAPFYKPEAPLDVKAFVVLTLRNSPLESLQSDLYAKTGLNQELSTSQIITLTSAAVRYFTEIDLESLADNISTVRDDDIYFALSQKFPVAWNALSALANSEEDTCTFPVLTRSDVEIFSAKIMNLCSQEDQTMSYVKDGFDPTIEMTLAQKLHYAAKNQLPFFTGCFKMLSRNPELLLYVIEFLMIHSVPFVTSNYYISNGYAEKRKYILKAAHNWNDVKKDILNTTGVSKKHREVLESHLESN